MCEEFFESESLLTGVCARINAREICIWWGLMQVKQRIEQRGHVVLLANFIGQQFIGRRGLCNLQYLTGKVSEPALLHAFGGRVDRR